MSRGGRREKIFLNHAERQDFIKVPVEACQKTGWQAKAKPHRQRRQGPATGACQAHLGK
jgi:hypothetical protein